MRQEFQPKTYPGHYTVVSDDNPTREDDSKGPYDSTTRPFVGKVWWNSLYWTNFPALTMTDPELWERYGDSSFFSTIGTLNKDGKLSEQYITYSAAREDLCIHGVLPKGERTLSVACMQYEGARETMWSLPLSQGYYPKRDNHQPYHTACRRFGDNGVLHLGLAAADFAEKVAPLEGLDAHVMIMDYTGNPTHGTFHALMRINGWPFRISKIGTHEAEEGRREVKFGIYHFNEEVLWSLLEGDATMAPTGPNGEVEFQGNQMIGKKFYAELLDFDNLGHKRSASKQYDPEIPANKGYVWFTIVDTITVPSTGKKGVKIQILDEGIVPAWLDLQYMQVWAGGLPLGYLNTLESDPEISPGSVKLMRVQHSGGDVAGDRKVVVENPNTRIVFEDPVNAKLNDLHDLGWAVHDLAHFGCDITLGPRPGPWASREEVGSHEGLVMYNASGPPKLWHFTDVLTRAKSDYNYQRRLVC